MHAARHDVECVVHLHSRDGVAVSATEAGLLPLNQSAMLMYASIGQRIYAGVATNEEERARIVADLGSNDALFLDYFGTLTVGKSIGEAFYKMSPPEWACSV